MPRLTISFQLHQCHVLGSCVNNKERLILFIYFHKSCTSNGDYLDLSIKTGNAHIERMLSQAITNSSKVREGGVLKHSSKWRWRPNCGYFHNYRNKLFSGKPFMRLGGATFVFIFVVLSSLAALLSLLPTAVQAITCVELNV